MHGPSGPRRGNALGEIGIIPDGALLLHNGVVAEYGVSRRVENLAAAQKAREIDATGRIVMPAFVDADGVLAYPRLATRKTTGLVRETPLRLLAKRTVEGGASNAALDYVRHGVLSVGAHTGYAFDLRDTMKVLRIQNALQGKPLRIRSILSLRREEAFAEKWLISSSRDKLALLLDLMPGDDLTARAVMAAHHNFAFRLRVSEEVSPALSATASELGAVAILAPPPVFNSTAVHVVNTLMGQGRTLRDEINSGVAVAIASGYQTGDRASCNPQYLLQQAVANFGLTPAEALTALTYNAARSLRIAHAAGSLEPGKSADVIIVDVPDYRDMFRRAGHNDVALAIRAGRVVYRRSNLYADLAPSPNSMETIEKVHK